MNKNKVLLEFCKRIEELGIERVEKGTKLKVVEVIYTNEDISEILKDMLDVEINSILELGNDIFITDYPTSDSLYTMIVDNRAINTFLILGDLDREDSFSITPNIQKVEKIGNKLIVKLINVSYVFQIIK